jgi:hypothetical protein
MISVLRFFSRHGKLMLVAGLVAGRACPISRRHYGRPLRR